MDISKSFQDLNKNMLGKGDVFGKFVREMAQTHEPFTVKLTERPKKIYKLFKRRKCTTFVDRNSLTDEENRPICDGCKQVESEGHEKNSDKINQWNFRQCTNSMETDAYGTVIFPGSRFKSANYICVDVETSQSDLIAYMIQRKGWDLKPPKLIMSVIGSGRNLVLSRKMKKEFKRGLIKAAASTSAWIITGGTDNGVMQLVGEAVGDEYHKYGKDLVLLGISSWGNIALRDRLINKEKKSTFEFTYSKDQADHLGDDNLYLCPNNTHFILVDDGSQNESNREFQFRANFEDQLRFTKVINESNRGVEPSTSLIKKYFNTALPTILIVVGGDFITLKRISLALLQKIPVLVVADSKGCADLIVDVCKLETKTFQAIVDLAQNSNIFHNELLDQSHIDSLRMVVDAYAEKLIHIFDLNSDQKDIELSILTAFINANPKDFYQNIKLALKWNRFDMVKDYISTGNEQLESKELSDLMETALVENKPQFVRYALDQGLNLGTFLSVRCLKKLYNSKKVKRFAKNVAILERFKRKKTITFANIRWFLKENLFDEFEEAFLPSDVENLSDTAVENPEQNLFVWSLLFNRPELAKIFWKLDSYHISTALFASRLLKSISKQYLDLQEEFLQISNEFEQIAIETLKIAETNSYHFMKPYLLLYKVPYYRNMTCLQMAVYAESYKFVGLQSIQDLLDDMWHGPIDVDTDLFGCFKIFLCCISVGLLAPMLLRSDQNMQKSYKLYTLKFMFHERNFDDGVNTTNNLIRSPTHVSTESLDLETIIDENEALNPKEDENVQRLVSNNEHEYQTGYLTKLKMFFGSPLIVFIYETAFFSLFLILFSYMLLCRYVYENTLQVVRVTHVINKTNSSSSTLANRTYSVKDETTYTISRLLPIEWIILFWVFSYFFDEIRQMFLTIPKTTCANKLKAYFSSHWNLLDFLGCVFFTVGFVFRIVSIFTDETYFNVSRIIYAVDLLIWYMRLLHVCMAFKPLGPKLIMIRKMMLDLIVFLIILLIFVLMFGVTTQATMYPGNELNFDLLKNVIGKAYWPVYGEMAVLDEIENSQWGDCSSVTDGKQCVPTAGAVYSLVLLIIYVIIANVLLLNLLIAMFSFQFNLVQENTDTIWKFQKYQLITEYENTYAFPPPICLVQYLMFAIRYFSACRKGAGKYSTPINGQLTENEEDAARIENYYLTLERESAEEYLNDDE